jgi:phosphoribosyl-ATP pyrophosphohydrolase/phosphoribosyl-AMP cyclohydrolase
MGPVEALRAAVSCSVTAAGGVSTLAEIEALAALGCDVQLGMALYTGKISLADAFVASLNWKKAAPQNVTAPANPASSVTHHAELGPKSPIPHHSPLTTHHSSLIPHHAVFGSKSLLPVIAQSPDGQIMMTGFADPEAVAETFKRGSLCFHSRTRNKLWMKGETSGNTLKLLRLRADCDRDALLAVVEPIGPVCHTGAWTCFDTGRRYTWEYLQAIIAERFRNPSPGSYTATLDDELVREKVMEEAEEVCTAKTHDEVVWEAADLLYFTTALITRAGVNVGEVLDELDRRHKK